MIDLGPGASIFDAGQEGADHPLEEVTLHLPFAVADYADFYSSLHHASNVGRMFRPDDDPLPPNWRHLPIGYHGRAGTVVPSGTPIARPHGQRGPGDFGPTQRLDVELELGFVIGTPSDGPVPIDRALDHVFGVVLLNDWSARDLQAWEYRPLGPFLAKSFATSISHWVTPLAEPAPHRPRAAGPAAAALPARGAVGVRHPARARAQRHHDRPHQRRPAVLERRPADRPPDVERRDPARRRPARLRHDLRPREAPARLPARAELERRGADRARRRQHPHVPRGRRRGRAARRRPGRGPRPRQRPLNSGWRFSWKALAPSA